MAHFERNGARIHYQIVGRGDPVLLLAPGGLRSSIAHWAKAAFNPLESLAENFQLIAMDQRNAGQSTAPIQAETNWTDYTDDQLGLMNHLGIQRFDVLGMCIGGPFGIRLCRAAPDRVRGAVLFQPIGVANNRQVFYELFDQRADDLRGQHPQMTQSHWREFRANIFDGDFMFGSDREDARACSVPLLVLRGDDIYHPETVSRELVELAANARLIENWRTSADHASTTASVVEFLRSHA